MPQIKIEEFIQALSLAAEKHKYQRRAGYDALPYINHLIKVTQNLMQEAGEKDRDTLLAALLHDILEDTNLSRKELAEKFGEEVAAIVTELTDDMSLDYETRKRLQIEGAKSLSPAAKKIRISDKASNLRDIFTYPLSWSPEQKQAYLETASKVVDEIRGTDEALEKFFDRSLDEIRQNSANELKITEQKPGKLDKMIAKIDRLIQACIKAEVRSTESLANIHPRYHDSARNLIYYREFRQYDLRKLQESLGSLGLSRLAKAQAHILAGLKNTRTILNALREGSPIQEDKLELSFKKGSKLLRSNAKRLLGKAIASRSTRIMVTMPTIAAENYELVEQMVQEGMDCARINCAHDHADIWEKIIGNVRKAADSQGKVCKIAMDLAGPKIRTGQLKSGPKVRKYRPVKDVHGKIDQAMEIWIGPEARKDMAHLPIAREDVAFFKDAEEISFLDARSKKRKFRIDSWTEEGLKVFLEKTVFLETGSRLFKDAKRQSESIPVGELPYKEGLIMLNKGDHLRLDKESLPGAPAQLNKKGALVKAAHISCTAPAIFEQVKVGEKILFDDGKIEGLIEEVHADHLWIKITYAAEGGGKLREDKGINLPESELLIKGLTDKDRIDLHFLARHADIVNFSFVNSPEDVQELIDELTALDAIDRVGIILKIETQQAFNQLTEILLAAMQVNPVGVMIARGDLAIETGWYNIGRVQEEILSFCQAAHISDIWATQVLEGLAKKGIPSRAEITDAVMAQRADCVMLNKGPYILDAIRLLNRILVEMESFAEKNIPFSPKLEKASK